MIFDYRSNSMLKYEKSKAKLIEFNVDPKDYPDFPFDSDDLTYTTILILSCYCEEFIKNPASVSLPDLKKELESVSQYYDTTVKTQLRKGYSDLFLLLGATAYFLADNFGSAKVLIQQIEKDYIDDTIQDLLYATLNYILTGKWKYVVTNINLYQQYFGSLKRHFQSGSSFEEIEDVLKTLRKEVYLSNEIMDVNFVDFLYAVALYAKTHSAWILLPQYTDYSAGEWARYLSRDSSVRLLWPAQKAIFKEGTLLKRDIVVPLPTGVGKTKSIEIILRSKFMDQGTSIAVIIAPLRALCNEITIDLTMSMGDEMIINQFTDTAQEDFDLSIIAETKYTFICTPEKFSYILRHEPDFITFIDLFIFDEAHLFDDTSRGTQYELLVSEIARNRNETAQMLLFSAVLSNAKQISGWLFDDEDAIIDPSAVKSTEKSIGFLSTDQNIHYYEKDNMGEESFFVPKSIIYAQLELHKRETKERVFPEKKAKDYAIYYGIKLCGNGGSAIFAGQARSIPSIMGRIVDISERGYDVTNLLVKGNWIEAMNLSHLFLAHYGKDSTLTQAAQLGAVPHYADMPNGLKMAVEYALRKEHIYFVVCTTTLAEGVNIPIKYLFLSTFSLGNTSVQIRKMQNLVGRTARSGIYTEGSAIITDFSYFDNKSNWKNGGRYRWADCKRMFDYGSSEACMSAILSVVSNVQVDYGYYYPAESLYIRLYNNYGKTFCFSELVDSIKNDYKISINDDERYERYKSNIDTKVLQLKLVFENIENYLSYIYNMQQNSEGYLNEVENLVTQTFAYYLGENWQRIALEKLFERIAQNIIARVGKEDMVYFSKSLYGIEISKYTLAWVNQKINELEEYSSDELLTAIFEFYIMLFPDENSIPKNDLQLMLNQWLLGKPYINIYNYFDKGYTMSQVEKTCSKTFSYHFCFFIGNIVDAIGDRAEELVERIMTLQKQVKFGVPSLFQMFVCENVFDDRVIAGVLEDTVDSHILTIKQFKQWVDINQDEVFEILEEYPEYFSYRFRMYIK